MFLVQLIPNQPFIYKKRLGRFQIETIFKVLKRTPVCSLFGLKLLSNKFILLGPSTDCQMAFCFAYLTSWTISKFTCPEKAVLAVFFRAIFY